MGWRAKFHKKQIIADGLAKGNEKPGQPFDGEPMLFNHNQITQ